ncbi:MAG: hypothetical protein K1X55_04480 [Chitinophagales bacterium]|nr:hypothetical protein [Chitinophagales bacterium]
MYIIILFIVLPLVSILLAIFSDKIRDKFVFEKQPNEEIMEVEVDVELIQNNNERNYKKGILYLTNQRLIFFKYKFGWLELIPILGSSLAAIFIDKNNYWQLPLFELLTYQFEGKIVQNHNKTTLAAHGYTSIITKSNALHRFDIPLNWQTQQKSNLLLKLDKFISQKSNPNISEPTISYKIHS